MDLPSDDDFRLESNMAIDNLLKSDMSDLDNDELKSGQSSIESCAVDESCMSSPCQGKSSPVCVPTDMSCEVLAGEVDSCVVSIATGESCESGLVAIPTSESGPAAEQTGESSTVVVPTAESGLAADNRWIRSSGCTYRCIGSSS